MNTTIAPVADKPRSLDELRATVSASRLNTWLSCRLKFYFRYVLGITKPRTAALYVGHTVHGVLKLWNQAHHPTNETRSRSNPKPKRQEQHCMKNISVADQQVGPTRFTGGGSTTPPATAPSARRRPAPAR